MVLREPSSGCGVRGGALEPYVHDKKTPSPLSPLPPGLKPRQTRQRAASVLLFNIWHSDYWGGGSCHAPRRALDSHAALRGFFVLLARVQMRIRRGPLGAVERMGVPFWACHSADIWLLTGTRATQWGQGPSFGGPHRVVCWSRFVAFQEMRGGGGPLSPGKPHLFHLHWQFLGNNGCYGRPGPLTHLMRWLKYLKRCDQKVERLQSVAETDYSDHPGLNSHQIQLSDQRVSSRFQPVATASVQKPWLDPLCGGESCNWPHWSVPCIHCFPKFERLLTGPCESGHGIASAGRRSGNHAEPDATWKSNQIQSLTFCLECIQGSRARDADRTWTFKFEEMKVSATETFSAENSSLFTLSFSGRLAFALWLAHYGRARAAAGQRDETRRVVENSWHQSYEKWRLLGISAGLTTSLDKFKVLGEKRTSK